MSYNKKTWQTGDTITAEALNNLEQGCDDANVGPLAMVATLGVNESSKKTLTMNKTAEEVYEAAAAGRLFKVSFAVSENNSFECILAIGAIKRNDGGNVSYQFRADTDTMYFGDDLAADDPVVLTEV